jgi:hypothetical protein
MSFDFIENFTLELPDFSKSDINFSESFNSKNGLIIEVAAIHEGLTSNYNNYSAQELEKALQSWVDPYPKPIILNHDLNTEAIGRVMAAKMDKEEDGSSFVRLQIAITDPVAAQKVLDKRYLTGSVGGRAGKAVCSVSGEDLATEDASGRPKVVKYKRGKVYKGKLAYVDMQDISFKEYSFVNQPADQKSGVRALRAIDGKTELSDSENWIARSNAFVLSMDNEDIFSIQENRSILSDMKKKESKPIYLQLKGAFLTALSIQENENYKYNDSSLLSDQNKNIDNCQENSNMDQDTNGDDILAAVQELSDDLSTISVAKESEELEEAIESEETIESEVVVTEADSETSVEAVASEESESKENGSKALPEEAEEIGNQEVDSANSSEAEEDQGKETAEADLTDTNAVSEQDAIAKARIQSLEEENKKLKSALHRTLIERVVDTRIGLGFELSDDREKLIEEYSARTASSLADSLRDLAKTPSKSGKRIGEMLNMPTIASEAEVSVKEENVLTIDMEEEPIKASDPKESFEQILVDALMGRRKL